MELLILTWEDIYNTCIKLAKDIIKDESKIDVIIGISRGGLIPARIFADIFDIHNIFIVFARYYRGINERLEKPIISINTDIEIRDKNILIIDDIADTGTTMLTLTEMLKNKPNQVKTLTLYKKSRSVFKPDYYAEVSDKWVVFPWERFETLREIIKRNEDYSILNIDKDLILELKIIKR